MFGVDRHCSRKRERRSSEARLHYLNIYFHLLSTCNLLEKKSSSSSSGSLKHQTTRDLLWFKSHVTVSALTRTSEKRKASRWFLNASPLPVLSLKLVIGIPLTVACSFEGVALVTILHFTPEKRQETWSAEKWGETWERDSERGGGGGGRGGRTVN